MKSKTLMIASAVSGVLALGATLSPAAHADGHGAKGKEKCYGVVKAGKNDCATKSSSCAGSATSDGQSDAFVVVPKGLCEKLVGGSTSSS